MLPPEQSNGTCWVEYRLDRMFEAVQIGGRKDFDAEVYREQIRAYNASKVAAPKRAYKGAGDILRHPGASRPESQQVQVPIVAPEEHELAMDSVAAAQSEAPASLPPSVPPSEVPMSVVPE